MVLAKKTRVTGIWQLSHYTENKKNSKKPKKLRTFQKNSRYRDLTVVKSRKSAQKKPD